MRSFVRLLRSNGGASAAELALILPLFLILFFGVIDGGRFMWEYNRAEKATQVGVRTAIVTNVLSTGLRDADYTGQTYNGVKVGPGDTIPAAALGTMKCTSTTCTCETAPCPAVGTFDSTTFNDVLVARMQGIDPTIKAENVVVRYSGSGLGYASSGSMEISPMVTVTLHDVPFTPITTLLFASFTMPDLSATLTSEDASGSYTA
jgi:Flp pilus assembly protein TadG